MKLAAGRQFGSWILIGDKPVGEGGNAVVWEAHNEAGQKAAVKFLKSCHWGNQREKRFRTEIEFLLKERGRSGILHLIDFQMPVAPSENDRLWFATPLATPFSTLTLSGPANLVELVRLLAIISKNLSKLHDEGKWHRDLKPENLLLLAGEPVIGDFGLVDFPDKSAVTTGREILGPLFYVAPEMMQNAENEPAGPADVYSLAKTLWVLASGNRYPLQGQQRMDTPALRLSTYCPHPNSNVLDSLLEKATAFEPAKRPTMRGFSDELFEWLKIGQIVTEVNVDLKSLARECAGIFEPGISAERNRQKLIQKAESVLVSFDKTLDKLYADIKSTTGISPQICQTCLYERFQFIECFGGPRLIWRQAREVRVTTKVDIIEVFFHGFVQVEALQGDQIRVLVGYLSQPLIHERAVMTSDSWNKDVIAPSESAVLLNNVESLKAGLLQNLPGALRDYMEKVNQLLCRR